MARVPLVLDIFNHSVFILNISVCQIFYYAYLKKQTKNYDLSANGMRVSSGRLRLCEYQ